MLTFFTTGKPFRGHDGVIQRNALKSWTLLHSDIEVILFGDEEGAAEVCAELGLLHEPCVERHELRMPYVSALFSRAQQISRHDYLCFANCDIVLFNDFLRAFEIARAWEKNFLAIGRRWDADVTEAIDFEREGWGRDLRALALSRGVQQDDYWIDFFLFRKGMYREVPPLIVGHCHWDNWMVWRALSSGAPVIDFSAFVTAVHQNHGYNAKFGRVKGVASDALSEHNFRVIGGRKHARTIKAATHRLGVGGGVGQNLRRFVPSMPRPEHMVNPLAKKAAVWVQEVCRFLTFDVWLPSWHFLLNMTRPLRSTLGLRRK